MPEVDTPEQADQIRVYFKQAGTNKPIKRLKGSKVPIPNPGERVFLPQQGNNLDSFFRLSVVERDFTYTFEKTEEKDVLICVVRLFCEFVNTEERKDETPDREPGVL